MRSREMIGPLWQQKFIDLSGSHLEKKAYLESWVPSWTPRALSEQVEPSSLLDTA